jgi:hypothetical protein
LRRDSDAICEGFQKNFDTAQFVVGGNYNKAKILLFTYAAGVSTPRANKNPGNFQPTKMLPT